MGVAVKPDAHEPDRHPPGELRILLPFGTTSMFKKLVPVIALALIAWPGVRC
jgi:hypothetical protein